MGDIDSSNFSEETLGDLEQCLKKASMVSIDLEMTGISFPNTSTENGADTVPFRYLKLRSIAATFGIIQVGVAVFESCGACRVFNFHVFPRPVTEGDVSSIPLITMCSAATNFNRSNGMDFGRWINRGITYTNGETEKKLADILLGENGNKSAAKAWDKLLSGLTIDSSITLSEEYTSQEKRVLNEIEEFLNDPSRNEYKVPFIHGGQKWLKSILSSVHAKYPDLRLVEEVSGGGSSRCISKKSSDRLFNDYIGFRRVWKMLTQASSAPVVFHNGFLDLVFCFQHFENDLPESISDFKREVTRLFPGGFFDTRLVAIESGLSMGGSAALETMADLMQADPAFQKVTITASGQYDSGNMTDGGKLHDAGYDALLTGKVFRALESKISNNEDLNALRNYMCVSRCLWAFSADTPNSDRLLFDTGPGRRKIVRVITEMNEKCSTRDVLSSFEEVKAVAGQNSSINIQWINDTSGFLLITLSQADDSSADTTTVAINNRLMEIAKSGGNMGNPVKLLAPQEFVKKQLDEFNPEASSAQKFRL